MTVVIKVIFVGLCIAFINPIFRKNSPEFAVLITVGGAVVIFTLIYGYVGNAFAKFRELAQSAGVGSEYISLIIKIIAVAYLCEYSASAVEDAGEKATAKKIELTGKLIIFVMTFPILQGLFEAVSGIVGK